MLTAIENIFDKLRDIISNVLDAEMLFLIIAGINLLLGLILLFSALGAHKKTKQKILRDGARREKEAEITAALLPRGASVLVPLAIFLFAIFVILCEYFSIMPYFGLLVFELFNILSRLIYKAKTKKVKALYTLYLEADQKPYVKPKKTQEQEPKAQPQPQQAAQPQPQQAAQPAKQQQYEPQEWVQPQQEESQTARERLFDNAAPVTRPTVVFESHTTTTTKTTKEPIQREEENTARQEQPELVISTESAPAQEEARNEPQARVEEKPFDPVQERPRAEATEEDDGHYQPFEPKRSVTQPNYSVERAPTYQVPRPPENPPQVDLPKQEPAPTATAQKRELPKNLDEYTIDDIVVRINQIKKEGATKQSMSELIYIIQKEREKPENKNPEKRQQLSEALSDLLKTMNKAK